ncbi:MAG: AlpA family transcriptional regulator [Candidatus Thiodiazotropha sp.]
MNRILRLSQVELLTGRSKSWIYSAMPNGDFPRQIKLSPQAVGWLESEVEQWIVKRIEAAEKVNQTNKCGCVSNNQEEMRA